jgi:hypothetical protein
MHRCSMDRADVRSDVIQTLEAFGDLPGIDRAALESLLPVVLQPSAVGDTDVQVVAERVRSLEAFMRVLARSLERKSRPKIRKLWSNLD